jgi:RNA polymerase sigma-70 factor (ECF subfamily)
METSMRARVHAGDPDAFRELFDQHARSVYNLAFRLTGNWSTAEDVVSLTFLEAWRLRERVDVALDTDASGGSLRPWLLGIATNVTRNVRRAARRHATALVRLPKDDAVPDIAEEVTSRVDDRRRLALVRTALSALRRPEREVLVLCVWSGLDYAEAAAVLGVPIGTVRSRLSRARKKLSGLVDTAGLRPSGEGREPGTGRGQLEDDRGFAVRSMQENTR